jgi:putative phage-type endonuclease
MTAPDRKTYVGSGDIAAIAGVSPYRSALEVWAAKIGIAPEQEINPAMRVGIALERPVLEALYAPGRVDELSFPGWTASAIEPWIAATPDALGHHVSDRDRVVECKVVGSRQGHRWLDEEDGAEAIPPEVLVQVQWQMLCTAKEIADVAALLGTDFRVYRVESDPAIQADLVTLARRFWDQVQTRSAPEITVEHADRARDLIARLYPRQTRDELVEFGERERALAENYLVARDAAKEAESAKDAAAALLCAAIGDGVGFGGTDLRATWKAGESGSPRWKDIATRFRTTAIDLGAQPSDLDLVESECVSAASRRLDVRRLGRR